MNELGIPIEDSKISQNSKNDSGTIEIPKDSIKIGKRVIKNTALLLVGRVFSIGFGIIYLSVLARYIGASGIGKIGTATSLVGLLIILADFGLGQLITRDVSGDHNIAGRYITNSLLVRSILSIVFAIIIVAGTIIAKYPSVTAIIIFIYGFAYIFDNFTDVFFSIFNAYEKMEYPAAFQTSRDLFNVVFSMLGIYLHASLVILVVVSAIGSLLKLVISLIVLRWRFVKPKLQFDLGFCRYLIITSTPFGILMIIQIFNRQIDTIFLSIYRPEVEVGWFSAANTLIAYSLLLPAMFLQAIFPVFSRLHILSMEKLQQVYQSSFRYLLLLGVPMCVGTIVVAGPLINLIYGPGFENAALALRILAVQLFFIFGYANGALLNATGGQVFMAKIEAVAAGINLLLAISLIPRIGFVGASLALIIPPTIFFLPVTIVSHRRVDLRLPLILVLKITFASLLMGIMVYFSLKIHINLFLGIFAIAPMIYLFSLILLRVVNREDLKLLFRLFKRAERTNLKEVTTVNRL